MSSLRQVAFQKLQAFLLNPGRFCLLVTGARGTGKCHSIQLAYDQIRQIPKKDLIEKTISNLKFVEARQWPHSPQDMDELLKKSNLGIVVLKDVDQLSIEQQEHLFDLLSTANGKFGIQKRHQVRMAFTSSKNIQDLRTENQYLIGKFWDRISQLIVELPSFKTDDCTIVQDFYATWQKMKFENFPEYKALANIPKNTSLESFLQNQSGSFEGNFRDLDKIAILYFNYRILFYGDKKKISEVIEKEIVKKVKEDFQSKSQLHTDPEDELSIFRFREENYSEMLKRYRISMRKWAVKKFGSVGNAEKKLGFKQGSLKNYV